MNHISPTNDTTLIQSHTERFLRSEMLFKWKCSIEVTNKHVFEFFDSKTSENHLVRPVKRVSDGPRLRVTLSRISSDMVGTVREQCDSNSFPEGLHFIKSCIPVVSQSHRHTREVFYLAFALLINNKTNPIQDNKKI